jgi:hypothetical protein
MIAGDILSTPSAFERSMAADKRGKVVLKVAR